MPASPPPAAPPGAPPPDGAAAERAAEKARLRDRFRAARAALTDEAWAAASAALVARVLALPEVEAARTVHVFWPVAARREVDTRPLIATLLARGVRVVLPVVASAPGEAPRLVHRAITDAGALVPARFGLLEPPPEAPAVAPGELDAVVVPALAAARDGHRLGHGAGFYDAFLAETAAFTVCPVYASCLVPSLPAEPHDVPVRAVVTERETIRIPAPPADDPGGEAAAGPARNLGPREP